MEVYAVVVAVLRLAVIFMLILGTNCLCEHPSDYIRAAIAAIIGGVYSGLCTLMKYNELTNMIWYFVCMCIVISIAFGWQRGVLRRIAVYLLLSISMNGIAMSIGKNDIHMMLCGFLICILCVVCVTGKNGISYVPVELCYGGKKVTLTALHDTGNGLRDPVTGRSILVIGSDTAQKLIGFTGKQLLNPVETMNDGALPGLQLIPYRSIERNGGLLLGMYLKEVKIGTWKGGALVAFAPVNIGKEGVYQALTGG